MSGQQVRGSWQKLVNARVSNGMWQQNMQIRRLRGKPPPTRRNKQAAKAARKREKRAKKAAKKVALSRCLADVDVEGHLFQWHSPVLSVADAIAGVGTKYHFGLWTLYVYLNVYSKF